ncbi:serine protease SP24D [Drosophila subpulchrella]|uniref:serine protease SP24D n=1 Tax=Drosophila subpulchrella TaxID=1486046 RepID=UPI0018A12FAB|nr:serine protease SP24D [Drosophila subpulchrella]
MRLLITSILLILGLDYSASMWLKRYIENYHRPTYRNRAHSSSKHVNYNREALENRDKARTLETHSTPPFDPEKHVSYYVNVLNEGSVICAGALISHRMIITSTHCFYATGTDATYEYTAKKMTILTAIDFAPNTEPHQVKAFFMPVNRDDHFINHVALLALAEKLKKSTYRYIPLNRKKPKMGDDVKMAFLGPPTYKVTLYNTRVFEYDRCRIHYGLKDLFHISTLEPDFFCVRNKKHSKKSTCSTRPGDPLLEDNKLVGINIYGEHCDEDDDSTNMDIYIPIRVVVPFIQMATDALRAFTSTGPYNTSLKAPLSPLLQSLADKDPNIYVGVNVPELPFDDPLNGGTPEDDNGSMEHHVEEAHEYY